MSRRTPDKTRQAIADDIRTGKHSVRTIAKRHGVGVATVSKVAAEFGLTLERSGGKNAHAEPQTAHASAQRRFDAKTARAALTERLYKHANGFLDRAEQPYTVIVGTGPATQLITLKLPPLRDQQAAMTAAGIALDKAVMLENRDDDQGAETGKTMASDLLGLLGAAYDQHRQQTGADDGEPQ